MPAIVSVIVVPEGDPEQVSTTLESIAAQSYRDLEVLVVGRAGPDDHLPAVDLPDDRFRLVEAGPLTRGAARNLGAREARGEYIAFAEAGDVLPADAYQLLVASLAETGSRFAAGNVRVRGESATRQSSLHRDAFRKSRRRTDIRQFPPLWNDRYVTNKVFRRSFWTERELAFPDSGRYDDLAVAIEAHLLADAVDLVWRAVVHRRDPVSVPPTTDPGEITEGFAAVESVAARLAGHWRTKDRRRFTETVLDRELRAFLDALPDADDEVRAHVVARAAAYATGVESRVFRRLPALTRLKWHLARHERTTELVKVVRFERGKTSASIVRQGLHRYVVYPYWKDEKLAIPPAVYRARHEVSLRSKLHEVAWKDGKLHITGEAYINSVSMRRRWTSAKAIALRAGKRTLVVPARQRTAPAGGSGAWTWFTATIDPDRLRRRRRWTDETWKAQAAVFNSGLFRHGPLRGGGSGSGAHPPYHYVADDVRIVPVIEDGVFQIKVERVRAKVTELSWAGDRLEIGGVISDGTPTGLRIAHGEIAETVPAAEVDGRRFRATVPLSLFGADGADPAAIDDTRTWTVSVSVKGRRSIPLVMGADEGGTARTLKGEVEAIAEPNAGGYLRVRVRTARLVVTGLSWAADGTLTVSGAHPTHERGEIVLRGRGRRQELAYGCTEGTAAVPAAAVRTLAGVLPLRAGKWDILFRPGPGERALAVSLDPGAAAELPRSIEVARRGYTVENHGGRPVLAVTGDVSPEERAAQQKLREQAYRKVERTGLKDQVLYSCFNGRQYSCNPRAIHEEMVRQHFDIPQLWVVHDQQAELPDTVTPIRLNGAEWHDAMAASRYIVTNHRIGDWFQRHPDQIVLQTWHGTPLKKIGRDVKEVHFAYAPGMKQALQGAANYPKLPEWSYLLSPNPFSTKIMKRAFAFQGEIIESGYPRNDVLYSADAKLIATAVRARIGIPAGKRVVLYAPTWRDDQFYGRGRYKFEMPIDLDRARAVLGDDHVVLVRLHSNIVDGVPNAGDGFVYDVSLYPEIAELYLISDALVTDYSSAMFDYANTRRPMLFFTYDLADYRDRLRGFYFDFEAEAPGPLLETSDALIEALRAIGSATAPYAAAYDAFAERFCSLEDGKAAARVIDRLFRTT
ncbi:MAG TPA: CDP-glycerol glycerophosphotransferase family protein [Streptosporangiaceae bacterium]|nr:CDP-glycerol glycerophosphotransferase family protein [Streptosporangiaceae bacterium]